MTPAARDRLVRHRPTPAVVLNRMSDLLAWTTASEQLAVPIGALDGERPNLVRWAFADLRARLAHPDWEIPR